jgi:hypothetical protein
LTSKNPDPTVYKQGDLVLDGGSPESSGVLAYGATASISAGDKGSLLMPDGDDLNDSPDLAADPVTIDESADDRFQDYLMYKAPGDSIWVTIDYMSWKWSGEAATDSNGNWGMVAPGTFQVIAGWSRSAKLPTWTDCFGDLTIYKPL